MRRIWEFLSNRTVLTVLGFLALSVLLLLSVTTLKLKLGVALALLLAALLIWLALHLLRQRRARLASQAIGAMIEREAERAVSTSAPGNQHETGALRDRLVEAIKTIKTSRLGATSGKAALYELPWYVIIGNPAAGKSSAIINSGLQFPFAEKNGRIVQGIGGTRNCDWFFTTEGIFLDTAGRYAVQDEDRREWLSFLGLLKQHRAKAPINGIVIAASVSELMQSGPEFVIDLAKQLRQRVQELTEELGVFAPVYVLFTKADLISGFGEFFASADAQERARVWGATLPYDAIGRADAVAAFDQHFDLLYDGLRELSLASMALKRNEQISAGVFAFPLEFAALKAPLQTIPASADFPRLLFHQRAAGRHGHQRLK
jgi:type VI secretion system protein ImpL